MTESGDKMATRKDSSDDIKNNIDESVDFDDIKDNIDTSRDTDGSDDDSEDYDDKNDKDYKGPTIKKEIKTEKDDDEDAYDKPSNLVFDVKPEEMMVNLEPHPCDLCEFIGKGYIVCH